jgi:hypothetical protein
VCRSARFTLRAAAFQITSPRAALQVADSVPQFPSTAAIQETDVLCSALARSTPRDRPSEVHSVIAWPLRRNRKMPSAILFGRFDGFPLHGLENPTNDVRFGESGSSIWVCPVPVKQPPTVRKPPIKDVRPGSPFWYFKLKENGRWHELSTKTACFEDAKKVRRHALQDETTYKSAGTAKVRGSRTRHRE